MLHIAKVIIITFALCNAGAKCGGMYWFQGLLTKMTAMKTWVAGHSPLLLAKTKAWGGADRCFSSLRFCFFFFLFLYPLFFLFSLVFLLFCLSTVGSLVCLPDLPLLYALWSGEKVEDDGELVTFFPYLSSSIRPCCICWKSPHSLVFAFSPPVQCAPLIVRLF